MTDREEREKHIENLIALKDFCKNNRVFSLTDEMEQSLDYAISSIRTDLKYDLMYEGEDFYTKDEAVAMLTELKSEIEDIGVLSAFSLKSNQDKEILYEGMCRQKEALDVIQQKIDKLKESNND